MKNAELALAIAVVIALSAHAAFGKGAPVARGEGKPVGFADAAQGFAHFQAEQRAARFRTGDHFGRGE